MFILNAMDEFSEGTTLYIGVTSDVVSRCWQHREGIIKGFTQKYGVKHLVYFEMHSTMAEAILRERELKKWNRAWKVSFIEKANPQWRDLRDEVNKTWIPDNRCRE